MKVVQPKQEVPTCQTSCARCSRWNNCLREANDDDNVETNKYVNDLRTQRACFVQEFILRLAGSGMSLRVRHDLG